MSRLLPLLPLILLGADAPPDGDWTHAQTLETSHYILHTDCPREDAEKVGALLEAFREHYQAILPFREDPKAPKALVDLYDSKEDYDAREGRPVLGFFDPGKKRLCTWRMPWMDATLSVLTHEGTHHLNLLSLGEGTGFPPWFDEGLATYFETARIDGKSIALGDPSPLRFPDLQARAREGASPGWLGLEAAVAIPLNLGFENEHYGISWAFLHRLLHEEKDGKERLRRFRDAHLGPYFDPETYGSTYRKEFEKYFGKPPAAFDEPLRKYVQGLKAAPESTHLGRIRQALADLRKAPPEKTKEPRSGRKEDRKAALDAVREYRDTDPILHYYPARKLFRKAEPLCRKAGAEDLLQPLLSAQRAADLLAQAGTWITPGDEWQELYDKLKAFLAEARKPLDAAAGK